MALEVIALGAPVTTSAVDAHISREPGIRDASRHYTPAGNAGGTIRVRPLSKRQFEELERAGRGEMVVFLAERVTPAPQQLVAFQSLVAALRHCGETNFVKCPTYVLRPCGCNWRDCARPRQCHGGVSASVPGGCSRCVRVGRRCLRRIARVESNGDVLYITRHGRYRRLNLPDGVTCGITNRRLVQGEAAARAYARGDVPLVDGGAGQGPNPLSVERLTAEQFRLMIDVSKGGSGRVWP